MTATHVSQAYKFLGILSTQDSAIKSRVEFEDHRHSLLFLDINITNNTTKKQYKFKRRNHKHTY